MSVTQAYGTTLKWNAVAVAELTKIKGLKIKSDTIDTTTFDSPDAFKTSVQGMMEADDVGIEGFFSFGDTTGQLAMLTDMQSRTSRQIIITFPAVTGTTWTFNGYIADLEIGNVNADGLIPFTSAIKVSGKPVLAVAVSTGVSALTISNSAVLIPTFAIGTFDYVATVLTGVSSVTFTPTAAAGVITVNGSVVPTTTASGSLTLGAAGSVTVIPVVVTETNKAPKTYTVRVTRA